MIMIKNNELYIFAIICRPLLNLFKLDNRLMERCWRVNKRTFENTEQYHYNLEILDNTFISLLIVELDLTLTLAITIGQPPVKRVIRVLSYNCAKAVFWPSVSLN